MGGEALDQERTGQTDDVEVVAVDPRDEAATEALDRVAAGATLPLPAVEVQLELGSGDGAKRHLRHRVLDDGESRAEQAEAGDDGMGATVELAQHRACIGSIGGLRVDAAVELHGRVDPERDGAFPVDGARLSLGMGADELDRIGVWWIVLLVDRRDDLERDPQLLENRAALR